MLINPTTLPLDSTSMPEPTESMPPLFIKIILSQMSRLVTFKLVNVPVIDKVSARISLTLKIFPIDKLPATDKLLFMDTSL